MSKITKRKHVVREVLDDFVVPTEKQEIVKVLAGRGNNLHEVINSDGHTFLVSMPSKFRKNVWIKRGDFVIVDPIEEGDKVQGEIVHILLQEHIRHIKSEGLWPEAFGVVHQNSDMYVEDGLLPPSDSEEDDDLGLKVVNANRPQPVYHESSDDDDDDDDDDDKDEENGGECDDSEKDKNGNGDKKCTEKSECAHAEPDSR